MEDTLWSDKVNSFKEREKMDLKNDGIRLKWDTFKWSCTVGVNAGFDLQNQRTVMEDEFAKSYGRIAKDIYERTGIFITAVINPSRVIYHEEWGCPRTGELCFTLSGSCNPSFAEPESYYSALKMLAADLKKEWNQSTILFEIVPATLIYLTGDSSSPEL